MSAHGRTGGALAVAVLAGSALAPAPDRTAVASAHPPTIAQLHYDGGGDWYANPSSLPNLLRAIRERTGIRVDRRPGRIRLTDPDLRDYPYLYLTGHGNIRFSASELTLLRSYLTGGGFLHADDNYGLDSSFRREVRRLFPDRELVEVPLDHPVYRIFYPFPGGLPKVHEHDGLPARGLGIFLDGRLVLFYSYQSDLGDGWENPEVHGDPPEIREQALRMGINLFLYALATSPAP
ncbi:MAG: DUF4159 domain-containing protein [Gemmatimonadota bacterium]